ncbi:MULTISPECIES: helix-turn-helix transcriptional regulator [Silvimonas]|uniref:helix-turn-helix transcriptional regulator n=1 Tax=Silvimonas TaxID=300264 RepID=UPI0024B3339D|nr:MULTISPECIES: helix-turn-helix transcriptional regulator [Silvimonas]MDR3428493.1 helix-turn-helix transcriptional regulator [Silvimonas sp.]
MSIRRKELGEFLNALRQKCEPAAFGFPVGQRRRTQGLRREEVAQLADISPTWYTWIEQGREISVSGKALHRLAQAMRLDKTQRAYLFELAGQRDIQPGTAELETTPPFLQQIVDDFRMPAYVMGRYWDMLAWNAAAADLFGDWLDADRAPNLLRFVFADPQARTLVEDWESRAQRLVAEFRADSRDQLEDAVLMQLIDSLHQASPEFATYWKRYDVLERHGGLRGFNHPVHGHMNLSQVTFQLVDQDHLKLVLLTRTPEPE